MRRDYLSTELVQSVYFGGGTPSLLSTLELESILGKLTTVFSLAQDAEITLEANPDDLTAEVLKAWRSAGVNRLSIGLQSFNEEELKWMNRAHTAAQSLSAIQLAQDSGFDNITIDLIYGSKFQSEASWNQTLETALKLGIQHISAYNLTVEERTRLGNAVNKGMEPDVSDDLSSRQFKVLSETLRGNGFLHYEISNFARPGFEARHNSNYWRQKNYLGLGPSAHSFNGSSRQWNIRNNQVYVRQIEMDLLPFEKEELRPKDLFNEYVMTRLRTSWGVNLTEMAQCFAAQHVAQFLKTLEDFQSDFIRLGDCLVLNDDARLRADGIAAAFFILEETTD